MRSNLVLSSDSEKAIFDCICCLFQLSQAPPAPTRFFAWFAYWHSSYLAGGVAATALKTTFAGSLPDSVGARAMISACPATCLRAASPHKCRPCNKPHLNFFEVHYTVASILVASETMPFGDHLQINSQRGGSRAPLRPSILNDESI
jgi:hypothetical protein